MKKKFLMLIFHLVVIAFVLFLRVAVNFESEKEMTKFLEFLLMALYVYTLTTSKVFLDWLNSYMIFLYTLFLFNFTRIFLDLVNYKEFGWATKFANYYFFQSVRQEIITIFLITLLFTHLGFFLAIQNEKNIGKNIKSKIIISYNKYFEKIGMTLFLVSMPALSYKMIIQMKAIFKVGYEAYYTGIVHEIDYPFFTKGSGTIMTIGFLVFLMSIPSKKKFLSISSLYLIVKLIDSFKGARAIFLTQLLFIMWYYAKVYGIKIKTWTMVKLISFIMIFSQILVTIRGKRIFSFDLIRAGYEFLFSQGVSYLVLGYSIDLKSKIVGAGPYPYIFQAILGFKPQSMESLATTNSIADKITYLLDPKAFLRGEGIGSNYIAEFYELGYFWIIIGSIILGILIIKYEKYVIKSRFLLLTSYYFIPNLFYIPRGSFFGALSISNIIFVFSFYIPIVLVVYMYEKIKESNEKNSKRIDVV